MALTARKKKQIIYIVSGNYMAVYSLSAFNNNQMGL